MSDIIRSGMLSMSPTFRQYATSKTIDGKATPPQKPDDYKKYLDLKMAQDPKWAFTFSDASFISSYAKGGFNNYDFTTMMSQSRDLQKVWAFVESNPMIVAQVQSLTVAPAVVSPTIVAPVVAPSTLDTKAGKAAGVVGETVGTVAGATGAVIWNVATETVSTWSTILSEATKTGWAMGAIGVIGLLIGSIWKFGFWNTMMGVVGIGWASAIANAAENGTFEKLADKMKKGADKIGETVDKVTGNPTATPATTAPAPVVVPANILTTAFDISKISDFQKKWVVSVQNNKSLLDDIQTFPKKAWKQSQNADINTYLTTIHKDSLQNITLDKIIYTTDHDQSIFSDEIKSQLPTSGDIPDNASRYLIKRVLRSYIGVNTPLSASASGKKEWADTLETFKAKYPEATWKTKTLKDLINEINK
jgi:hypothetical protein